MPTRTRDPWRRAAAAALTLALLVACGAPVAPDPDPDPDPEPEPTTLTLTDVAPGAAAWNEALALTGTGFPTDLVVRIGDAAATVTAVDPAGTNATVLVPELPAGAYAVTAVRGDDEAAWSGTLDVRPPGPVVARFGPAFDVVPYGQVVAVAFELAPRAGGTGPFTCAYDLGVGFGDPEPCAAGPGSVDAGPFAQGSETTLRLRATAADGGVTEVTTTIRAERWAPFQRLEGDDPIAALAARGVRLAVGRPGDDPRVDVVERPVLASEPGTSWAPVDAALLDTVRPGVDLSGPTFGTLVGWLGTTLLVGESGSGANENGVNRFPLEAPGGDTYAFATREGNFFPGFVMDGLSGTDEQFVVAASSADAGPLATNAGRLAFRTAGGSGLAPTTGFVADDRGGSGVAAWGEHLFVGVPGFDADEGGQPDGGQVLRWTAVRDGASTIVNWAAPIEPITGGTNDATGEGDRFGEALAIAPKATGATIVVLGSELVVAFRLTESGDLQPGWDLPLGGRPDWVAATSFLALGGAPVGDLVAIAVGREDGVVELWLVGGPDGTDPEALGTIDATGATGPGAWVGNALALPFGNDLVLFDSVREPMAVGPGAP